MITDRIGRRVPICYQLIKTMTKFEKKLDISYTFSSRKKKQPLTRRNARQQRAHMTRSVRLHGHDVTLSNYKHDVYSVLLVLKSGW